MEKEIPPEKLAATVGTWNLMPNRVYASLKGTSDDAIRFEYMCYDESVTPRKVKKLLVYEVVGPHAGRFLMREARPPDVTMGPNWPSGRDWKNFPTARNVQERLRQHYVWNLVSEHLSRSLPAASVTALNMDPNQKFGSSGIGAFIRGVLPAAVSVVNPAAQHR